ncbi:MAG: hypothetical protein AAF598_21055 [Bacteroidota bacterium]
MKNLNHYVSIYKAQLQQGDILIAYEALVKFVMKLRVDFIKSLSTAFSFSGILHGFMDITYFYYTNETLKRKKLKLGFVLNHPDMRFEIWLLGNTKQVQEHYWQALKDSKWNTDRSTMPQYAILEAIIEDSPNFDDLPALQRTLKQRLMEVSREIVQTINQLDVEQI